MQYEVKTGKVRKLKLLPEEKFTLGILQRGFGGVKHLDAFTLTDPPHIKWEKVFETALKWNVASMLYPLLKGDGGAPDDKSIPQTVWKSMEATYIKTYMVNQPRFSELAATVKGLSEADVPVILLKGAHLAPFWARPDFRLAFMVWFYVKNSIHAACRDLPLMARIDRIKKQNLPP